jgi:hypothetical protein
MCPRNKVCFKYITVSTLHNGDNKYNIIIIIIIIIMIIQRMWNVKTRVIPVIIGATGTISKSFIKYGSTIPGNHEVKELQKTAILSTAHILRKVLM